MGLSVHVRMKLDTGGNEPYHVTLYWGNYTHNVTPMWKLAGVYDSLYKSDGRKAGDLVQDLVNGRALMEYYPDAFRKYNSPNGWGQYETALIFLHEFTEACQQHPKATVHIFP